MAPDASKFATEEEIKKRNKRIAVVQELGIGIFSVDVEGCDTENPYEAEALTYILQDLEVPSIKTKLRAKNNTVS